MIHHTLAEDWDHTTLQDVSRPLCAASVFLTDDSTFTQEVDLVMEVCIKTRRPVYLYVPMDTPDLLVDASRLQNPLNVAITNPGREALEDSIVRKIIDEVERAERPCILVDALTQRFGLTDDVREMLRVTGLPVGGVPDQTPVTIFFTTVTVPNFS